MPEPGGPSTQSGILFQNSVAAVYLVALLNTRIKPATERVISVSVEQQGPVDDIVVGYADGRVVRVQVKESLGVGTDWPAIWSAFDQAIRAGTEDTWVALGTSFMTEKLHSLREISNRARTHSDVGSWEASLSLEMKENLRGLMQSLNPPDSLSRAHAIFRRSEFLPFGGLEDMESTYVNRMPESSVEYFTLFRILRDKVAASSRIRGGYNAQQLLYALNEEHKVVIREQIDDLSGYRRSLGAWCSRIDYPVPGAMGNLYLWPRLVEEKNNRIAMPEATDDEALWSSRLFRHTEESGTEIDLADFPNSGLTKGVVVAGAGQGKSTLLRALAGRLVSDPIWVPALAYLPELAETNESIIDFLVRKTREDYDCNVDWRYYFEQGRVALLLDGLDEVPQNRAAVMKKIVAFNGRYQSAAWLVAVREGAAVGPLLGVPFLRIAPLSDQEVSDLMARYAAGAGGAVPVGTVMGLRARDSAFCRLTSVPLFLSLIAASGVDPTLKDLKRTSLIARFLTVAVHPEDYKPGVELSNDPSLIIDASMLLAEHALRSTGRWLDEFDALSLIRSMRESVSAESVLKDLTTCGLVRRARGRVEFALPTLQEYLVGRAVASAGIGEVIQCARHVGSRPWMQTLQFALEMMNDATDPVRELLKLPHDAYFTIVRLVTRSIANGARVARKVKHAVCEILIGVWLQTKAWEVAEDTVRLLLDAFASDPSESMQRMVKHGIELNHGWQNALGWNIPAELASAFMDTVLERPGLDRLGWIHVVAEANVPMVIRKCLARVDGLGDSEVYIMAQFIAHLTPTQAVSSVTQATRSGLPLPLNAAFAIIDPHISDGERKRLAKQLLECDAGCEMDLALALCEKCSDTSTMLGPLLEGLEPHIVEKFLAVYLARGTTSLEEKRQLLRSFASKTHGTLGSTVHAMLAFAGDEAALRMFLREPLSVPTEHFRAYLYGVTGLSDAEWLTQFLDVADEVPELKMGLPHSLEFGINLDVRFATDFESWSGQRRAKPHPGLHICAERYYKWAQETSDGIREEFLRGSARLGNDAALTELYDYVINVKDVKNSSVSLCISTLSEHGRHIPLERLAEIAIKDRHSTYVALHAIARHANLDSLRTLTTLYRDRGFRRRSQVPMQIEDLIHGLAVHLGVVIDRDEKGLLLIRDV